MPGIFSLLLNETNKDRAILVTRLWDCQLGTEATGTCRLEGAEEGSRFRITLSAL